MTDVHQSEISTEIDYLLERLSPLANGYCVTLAIENPKARGRKANQLVALTPGEHFGFRHNTVLVSVIGAGSALVDSKSNKVMDLVLAGVPAKLASALVDKLNVLFKDQ